MRKLLPDKDMTLHVGLKALTLCARDVSGADQVAWFAPE
jgi:hypothetical protein